MVTINFQWKQLKNKVKLYSQNNKLEKLVISIAYQNDETATKTSTFKITHELGMDITFAVVEILIQMEWYGRLYS